MKNQNNNLVIKGIKDKIDVFLSEFNNYFHYNIFQKYTEHIENLIDIKYKSYLEISHKYEGQIKEMELLLSNEGKLFFISQNLMTRMLNQLKKSFLI